ncbi:hypothetical protein KFE25_002388 [Diacronema lutheri]|uniref:Sepiapterin reductase n=1 Tax=Diacronema lutheri TaxID=2081491 RepID=A0A8J6C5M4_DIALT|nr:hypothetical protein KFE25_002388 [Diacronema lutheri]
MADSLFARTRVVGFPLEGRERRMAECPRCSQSTPVPLGPYAAAVECCACAAHLRFAPARAGADASLFFHVVEQPYAAGGAGDACDGAAGAPARELVLELDGCSRLALWPAGGADGHGARPVATVDLASELHDFIVGLAAAHAASASVPQQHQLARTLTSTDALAAAPPNAARTVHPFGILRAARGQPPILLRAPSARELALLAAAVNARRDVATGLARAAGLPAAATTVAWQGEANVRYAPGAGSMRALSAVRRAHVVLVRPAKLLVFASADACAPLRVIALAAGSHDVDAPAGADADATGAGARAPAAAPAAADDGVRARGERGDGAGDERRVRLVSRGFAREIAAEFEFELPTSADARTLGAALRAALARSAADTRRALHARRGRWLVVVTGASRGFGRAFVVRMGAELARTHAQRAARAARGAHGAGEAGAAGAAGAHARAPAEAAPVAQADTGAHVGRARATRARATEARARPLGEAAAVGGDGGGGGGGDGDDDWRADCTPDATAAAADGLGARGEGGVWCDGVHFLLIGRDDTALQAARHEIEAGMSAALGEGSGDAKVADCGSHARRGAASARWAVSTCTVDLADASAVGELVDAVVEPLLARARKAAAGLEFSHALLLNNAAELPPLRPLASLPAAALAAGVQVMALVPAALSAAFARHARLCAGTCEVTVVHTSSLFAVQPARSWGGYCVAKAAADMLHAVLALEGGAADGDGELPTLRALNYAPGPLDTDMQAAVRASAGCDPALAEQFRRLKAEGNLVQPAASAAVLVRLLLLGCFESGKHVDYYDLC